MKKLAAQPVQAAGTVWAIVGERLSDALTRSATPSLLVISVSGNEVLTRNQERSMMNVFPENPTFKSVKNL